jgi:ADP-glucose pyrophosphorylase
LITSCTVPSPPTATTKSAFFIAASNNNVYAIDEIIEKPKNPPPMPGNPKMCLASMGNYLFDTDTLHQWMADYMTILARAVADPERQIGQLIVD